MHAPDVLVVIVVDRGAPEARAGLIEELGRAQDNGTAISHHAPGLAVERAWPASDRLPAGPDLVHDAGLVHPLWWGGPPAKLKGLFDRALLPGFAFAYVEGKPLPDKRLAGRTARVLVTTDTPVWLLWLVYRNAWLGALRRQILDFTGLKVTMIKAVGPIRGARPGADKGWFAAARRLAG